MLWARKNRKKLSALMIWFWSVKSKHKFFWAMKKLLLLRKKRHQLNWICSQVRNFANKSDSKKSLVGNLKDKQLKLFPLITSWNNSKRREDAHRQATTGSSNKPSKLPSLITRNDRHNQCFSPIPIRSKTPRPHHPKITRKPTQVAVHQTNTTWTSTSITHMREIPTFEATTQSWRNAEARNITIIIQVLKVQKLHLSKCTANLNRLTNIRIIPQILLRKSQISDRVAAGMKTLMLCLMRTVTIAKLIRLDA